MPLRSKPLLRLTSAVAIASIALLLPLRSSTAEELPRELPRARDYAKALRKVMASYPADGTHRYYWPRKGGWKGTTQDLVYQGSTVAKGDPEGRCFCCGLTFEVFFLAWQQWAETKRKPFQIGDLDAKGVKKLISEWFGSNGDRRCLQSAVKAHRLGRVIDQPKGARPGDFVQFWRHSGSGHSVVFLGWEKDKRGRITALRYWSTQGSTKGIGINTERVGPKGIKLEEVYIARIGRN